MSATPTLLDKVDDTAVTWGDLALIGHYVLNTAAMVAPMRHASPRGSIDYAEPQDVWARIVHDFIRWCGDGTESPASERLQRLLAEVRWPTTP